MSIAGSKKTQFVFTLIFDIIALILVCFAIVVFAMRYNMSIQGHISQRVIDTELYSLYDSILAGVGVFGSIACFLHIKLIEEKTRLKFVALVVTMSVAVVTGIIAICLQYAVMNVVASMYCTIFIGIIDTIVNTLMIILAKKSVKRDET